VWSVDSSPPGVGGLDELEGHRETGGAAAGPLGTLVRNPTVANVDSIGFVVSRWIQCSAGKSCRPTRITRPPGHRRTYPVLGARREVADRMAAWRPDRVATIVDDGFVEDGHRVAPVSVVSGAAVVPD
jgi:hypothetical protein